MGRLRTELHRTLVHPISKLLGSAVNGLSGRGRNRRSQVLEAVLANVSAERDRLQAEIHDLVQYTDAELAHLKQTIEQLRYERDALQLQVWTMEEQLERLTQNSSDASAEIDVSPSTLQDTQDDGPWDESLASAHGSPTAYGVTVAINEDGSGDITEEKEVEGGYSRIDLSNLRLALVGGHPSTRRGVIHELQLNYGLRHWVEVPRMNEANTNRSKVKSKIAQCTLVVLITGYMSHRLTEIIFSLKEAGSLAGDVLQLNCKGKSGVVREILNHVEHVG